MRAARLAPTSPQNSDTGNGEAFGRLAGLSAKTLAMTGTPFNGKASSLFNLEYHLNPRIKARYHWGGAPRFSRKDRTLRGQQTALEFNERQRGEAESKWVTDMGVREGGEDDVPQYDEDTGAFTGTKTYTRPYVEAPGISPLLVAETLDHAIFFSLTDMTDALPDYQEIARPVALDPDMQSTHDGTRKHLKDYLIERRWEGDSSFKGAYFHWCVDWMNSAFMPYDVIHNMRHPISRVLQPHTVTKLDSMGTERIYSKEQELLSIVEEELAADRPCIIYCRQTDKRNIQHRLKSLIEQHIPLAKTFILEAKVDPERREALIEKVVAQGHNVIISNPELVKTGLDLVFAGTLIFFEPVYNLGTMMQAAGRNYRLNQKRHKLCKVMYLFYEGTMEHAAIQLMSRKQRAAKILQGDSGLTGLEALTAGDGGLEEALLSSVAQNSELVDPATLFKQRDETAIIDAEDNAYWNIALTSGSGDPLFDHIAELGAVLTVLPPPEAAPVVALASTLTLADYLQHELLCGDLKRKASLIQTIHDTIQNAIIIPGYTKSTTRQTQLEKSVMRLVHGYVARADEQTTARRAIELAASSTPLNTFAAVQTAADAAKPISAPAIPRRSFNRPEHAVCDVITTALQPCLTADETEDQQNAHAQHIDALKSLFDQFVAETPIFWEDGNDELLNRDIRIYLIRNHVADRDKAAQIASSILTALKPAALADAKARIGKREPARTRAKLDTASRLDAPLAPSVASFQARQTRNFADLPLAAGQLQLF